MQVFKCLKCGKIVMILKDSSCGTFCCGEEMVLLKANEVDAAVEKHVPVVSINGSNVEVKVGEVPHPMLEEHYIEWIVLETSKGNYITKLKPNEEAKANYILNKDEEVIMAYAYCNLHGLWKKEM